MPLIRRMLGPGEVDLLRQVGAAPARRLTLRLPASPWRAADVADDLAERGLVDVVGRDGDRVTLALTERGEAELALLGG